MPVISVNGMVDKERIIQKMEGQGGGDAQGVTDPKNIVYIKYHSSADHKAAC
jgi:hypothetical protein